jgi:transglutaminase-like putative cysteine protease
MALMGAPIMVVLFVLFPRVAPLWGMPGDGAAGRTGLSASMQVGSLASLALDSSVAMRLRFEGAAPAQRDLYFRGPVLTSFDGREWKPLRSSLPVPMRLPMPTQLGSGLQVSGSAVRYELTLEGNNHPWLPLLDATLEAPVLPGYTLSMRPDLQWTAERPIGELVRFKVQSYPAFRHGPLKPEPGLQDSMRLPAGFNPRTQQLALDLLADPRLGGADTATLVNAVLNKLRTGGYSYTLDPGVYGRDTADEFWFDRKEGFCEHIASSFVLLMRALHIPARVVTGYQGGELNALDGFWTVRQSDAHAWTEVWMEGQGWVRVDPTSAVAPGRTGSLQRLLPPRSAIAQALSSISPGIELNLRALWEATNNRWNQWVLNYSQAKQMDFLRNIGFASPSWQDLSTVLIGIVVLLSLLGAAWTQWERLRQDPWLRMLHGAQRQLQKAGLPVSAQAAPRQLAHALKAHATDAGPADGATSDPTRALELQRIQDWLLRLEAWRYAKRGVTSAEARAALGTLRREFRQIRWPQHLNP